MVEARSEAKGDIGVLVSRPDNPLCSLLLRGIASVLEPAGYEVHLRASEGETARLDAMLHALDPDQVRGVILCPHPLEQIDQVKRELARIETNLVVIGGSIEDSGHCSIGIDDFRGGELAAHHLYSIGCRRLRFIRSSAPCPYTDERWRGFASALARQPQDLLTVLDVTLDIGSDDLDTERLQPLIETQPDGIFCANDTIALSVMTGLQRLGVSVPGDVAIIGFDNLESAQHASTPLTSLAHPAARVGSEAAAALLDEIERGSSHEHTVARFIPTLIVRESTTSGEL